MRKTTEGETSSKSLRKLSDLTPDPANANRHTQRGGGMSVKSVQECGLGRSIVVDKYGVIIGGNQITETAAEIGIDDIQVVKSDGSKLVVVQRTDLDLSDVTDKRARNLSIFDNRVAEINLDWDAEVLASLAEDLDLGQFWHEDELDALLADVDDSGNDDSEGTQSGGGAGEAVISYNLIFDEIEQQQRWFALLRMLKETYPGEAYPTIAARLDAWLSTQITTDATLQEVS